MLDTVTNIVSAVFMEPRHSGPIKAKDNTGLVVREQGKCVLEFVCINRGSIPNVWCVSFCSTLVYYE